MGRRGYTVFTVKTMVFDEEVVQARSPEELAALDLALDRISELLSFGYNATLAKSTV